jgi:hypothetical protein
MLTVTPGQCFRVPRRLEQIEKLPARQQNYLLRTIDGFLRGAGVTA